MRGFNNDQLRVLKTMNLEQTDLLIDVVDGLGTKLWV